MRTKQFITLDQKTYFGGKAGEGTYQKIISQFPKHTTYIEGFLGLGAIMRYKKPAQYNIGIELDPATLEVWYQAKYNTNQLTPSNLTLIDRSFFYSQLPCFNDPNTLLYLDPPYTKIERRSNTKYKCELSHSEHKKLMVLANTYNCKVAISCYDNDLYKSELSNWRKIQFEVVTRGGTMATETLYMNYPAVPPGEIHDKRFLGGDYRTREVTRKRLNTIHRKIEKLNEMEKAILFSEIGLDLIEK